MGRVGELVAEEVGKWGITLDRGTLVRLERYAAMVREASPALGLTGRVSDEELARYHLADALSCLLVMPERPEGAVVDIGSGAGLPGVVLKLARPGWEVLLVESSRKKAAFLEWVVRELGLRGVAVLWERAEALGARPEYGGRCAWGVARAAAPLGRLVAYAWPLLRAGGGFVAQKGPRAAEEVRAAEPVLAACGARVVGWREVRVGNRLRVLVVLEKGKEFGGGRGID